MSLSNEDSKIDLIALFTNEEDKKPKEGEILPSLKRSGKGGKSGGDRKFGRRDHAAGS